MFDEQRIFLEVDELLKLNRFAQASEKMGSLSKTDLNLFYKAYPQHYNLLKQNEFSEFWSQRRTQLNPKFIFVSQPNIPDIDFVLGYVFYLLSLLAKNNHLEEEQRENINLSMNFNSIHAAQFFFHKLLMNQEQDVFTKYIEISNNLLQWKTQAVTHGTPGYLLLANGYFHLLKMGQNEFKKDWACFEHRTCICLWENLELAQMNELHSQASIYNAYFGKGLEMSTSMKLSNINDMKEEVRKLIQEESLISYATQIALNIYKSMPKI